MVYVLLHQHQSAPTLRLGANPTQRRCHSLQEGVPPLAAPARARGKWKLGVATKLHDAVHSVSTPCSPTSKAGSPTQHRLRPSSAGPVAPMAAAGVAHASPLASPARWGCSAQRGVLQQQGQEQQALQQHPSYSAVADEFGCPVDEAPSRPPEMTPVGSVAADAPAAAQVRVASRAGRARIKV